MRSTAVFCAALLLALFGGLSPRQASTAHAAQPSPVPIAVPTSGVMQDQAVTARAQTWFAMLQSGKIDRTQLTGDMNSALTNDKLAQLSAQLKPLGKPGSFTLVDETPQDVYKAYRYHLTFGSTSMVFTFVLDPSGKIAGLWLRPDES